ncbi:MAG: hypothetical protein Q8S14_03455 [Algoriphagus sp.]|jgi:hypothetical protein|uniref:hypothetical protein n=1 Tax=Algoriphagus sp. TaxID=1872435 RepID=UPI0027262008|nr:hypothetical protein [Algoriphagus sp.]MDO8968939.1 hypothetical protein [Algoriphagus sp.]MDP2041347.1 hypothetical protein [Algoriphagus sp.]MDP3202093.1 hypothetical protein [Algoriphagus sp.]MDP3470907.1 hypothetical protein [Algoriphagus sp.]
MKFRIFPAIGLLIWLASSCVSEEKGKKMDKLPYFNLSGYLDVEMAKLDGDLVTKTSRVNGKEKTVDTTYTLDQWKAEFAAFYLADINSPSLALSYSTETNFDYLTHKLLPEAKGKVKEIKIMYVNNYPSSITFRMTDKNLFFSSATHGEFHMNLASNKLDHYSIETTQKVWFLKPTNIKVAGIVR